MSLVATAPVWAKQTSVPQCASLPGEAPVVVVGAGLAGVATAVFLAEAGFAPVVLDARGRVGDGVSGRRNGLALPLLTDMPHRLICALGEPAGRMLTAYAKRGIFLLEECQLLDPTGALLAAAMPQERESHEEDLAALRALDIAGQPWSADQVHERTGTQQFGPGLWLPEAGRIDPGTAPSRLALRAHKAGAQFLFNTTVTKLHNETNGMRVQTTAGDVRCDVVVLASNAATAQLDPWFEDKVYPVRTQLAAWPSQQSPLPFPIRTQLGYATLESHPECGLVAGGCRWATGHLEMGETNEQELSVAVHEKLCEMARHHAPARTQGQPPHVWAGVMGFTCDGLPIIGPVPGRSRVVCCLGFGGHQATLGITAGRSIADELIGDSEGGVPAFCSTHRFT